MMTIHINADLRPVVKDRVGMLHWVMDPEVSGFIIGYDLSGNQVLICNFDVSLKSYFSKPTLNPSLPVRKTSRGVMERGCL